MKNNSKLKVGDIFTESLLIPERLLSSVSILVDKYSYITLCKDGTLIHNSTVGLKEFRLIEKVPFNLFLALRMSQRAVDLCKKVVNKNVKPCK